VNVRRLLYVSLAGLVAIAMLVIACGGDDEDSTATPTVTSTGTPATPTATRTPTPARTSTATATANPTVTATETSTSQPTATESPEELTGVPAVDAVIGAVLAGNLDDIESRVELRSLACGSQGGIGGPPPCPSGQPDGTTVQAFPVATCEGEWRPDSSVRASFQPLMEHAPELYAVYGMPPQFQERMPDGQYVAVFSYDAGSQGRLGAGVVISADSVVGLWYGCGATADQIVPAGTSTILPPRG
jgi:hypothetical protein